MTSMPVNTVWYLMPKNLHACIVLVSAARSLDHPDVCHYFMLVVTLLIMLRSGFTWGMLSLLIAMTKVTLYNRRNILCGQINNALCYFGKCQSVVRQKLMHADCYSLYGSVLWDLYNTMLSLCALRGVRA